MLVHICDKCHEIMKGPIFALRGFEFVVEGMVKHRVEYKEFCCLNCMYQYLVAVLAERDLLEDLKK